MITQEKGTRAVRAAIWLLFGLYTLLMLRLLIFRGGFFTHRELILIPFQTIRLYANVWGSRLAFINILGNIGVFVPLGLFLQLLARHKQVWRAGLVVMLASLAAEGLQYLLGVGVTDIDDLILNTLGGLLGIGLYRLLCLFAKTERARLATGLVVLLLLFAGAAISLMM